jgi:hypothetical protein
MRPRPDRAAASSRRRDVITCAAALLGHAALLALALGVGRGEAPAQAPQDEVDKDTLIELFAWAPAPRETPPTPAAPSAEPGFAARDPGSSRGPGRETLPDLPPPARPEIAPAPTGSTTSAPIATSEFEGPAPTVPMAGGGLSIGTPVWAVPGALPAGPDVPGGTGPGGNKGPLVPKKADAPGKQVLRDEMLSRDRDLGLGNPGATAVANAVAAAVRSSNVPPDSSAVIVAQISGDGVIVSVGIQQFSAGDTRAWNGVAQAATAALGKKKLGLAGLGPRGAVVRVSVRSSVSLPSGAKSPVQGILPSLTDGPPRDVMPAQGPDGDACAPERRPDGNTLCGVGMKIGGFDVADMLGGRHRSVKTSFRITLHDGALALAAPAAAAPPAPSAAPAAGTAAPSTSPAPPRPDAAAP